MNDKLKRLSKNVSELFSNKVRSPQQVFDIFNSQIYKSQQAYFNALGGDSIIKIVLYIFSLKKTGDFKMGDDMINKLSFASVFYTTGYYTNIDCDFCEGRGIEDCGKCDSNGYEDCDACGGDGEGMDGNTCRRCSGNGTETCIECNGAGEVECNECDGNGEFETDELIYIHHYICTWDNEVKTQFKLNEKTNEPAMSEYDFDRLGDEYIVLMSTENNSELRNFVEINQVYCISYLNEINLIVSDSSSLNIYWSDYEDFLSYKL